MNAMNPDIVAHADGDIIRLVWEGDKATFAKAFIEAQKNIESIRKGTKNDHFKSKYADLAEVNGAVVPPMNEAGIGVLQVPGFDGDMVAVATVLLHESGASVTGVLNLRPSKSDPQGVGSAITYGRRYAVLAMSGAAPEDDDGNAASGPRVAHNRRPTGVVAAESALLMCQSAEDVDRWEANNKAVLETMPREDRVTILALHKATRAKYPKADEVLHEDGAADSSTAEEVFP